MKSCRSEDTLGGLGVAIADGAVRRTGTSYRELHRMPVESGEVGAPRESVRSRRGTGRLGPADVPRLRDRGGARSRQHGGRLLRRAILRSARARLKIIGDSGFIRLARQGLLAPRSHSGVRRSRSRASSKFRIVGGAEGTPDISSWSTCRAGAAGPPLGPLPPADSTLLAELFAGGVAGTTASSCSTWTTSPLSLTSAPSTGGYSSWLRGDSRLMPRAPRPSARRPATPAGGFQTPPFDHGSRKPPPTIIAAGPR